MKAKINRAAIYFNVVIEEKHAMNMIKHMSIKFFEDFVTG
jgi:hypothetical protein